MSRDANIQALRATLARADPPGPYLARLPKLDDLDPEVARLLREVIDNQARRASAPRWARDAFFRF